MPPPPPPGPPVPQMHSPMPIDYMSPAYGGGAPQIPPQPPRTHYPDALWQGNLPIPAPQVPRGGGQHYQAPMAPEQIRRPPPHWHLEGPSSAPAPQVPRQGSYYRDLEAPLQAPSSVPATQMPRSGGRYYRDYNDQSGTFGDHPPQPPSGSR
ncbi:hypothetical protein FB45DRAFT_1038905 [Roridomyces roridus]|uniref:Uncharacterized protein n=1 Tax=Roridomyces roridus TaxID=1738132 RepID=A0AAD7FB44_9AGAR|nr:hypothetical protein FB45DRAFT_1038905 [Roridomyces roridus]